MKIGPSNVDSLLTSLGLINPVLVYAVFAIEY